MEETYQNCLSISHKVTYPFCHVEVFTTKQLQLWVTSEILSLKSQALARLMVGETLS